MIFYNAHIHTFTDKDVPEKFLPLRLVRILSRKAGFRIISRGLNYLNPFTDDDQFDRYVKFIKIGKLGSQEKIFLECKKFYPGDTRFGILSMDMAYMGAGKVKSSRFKVWVSSVTGLSKENESPLTRGAGVCA